MASLIVVCPHCLTWIEIHADCCTECGSAVNVDDADPADEALAERLGTRLLDLGPIRLLRRGWPERGQLMATTEGLLFLPVFAICDSGALEAVTEDPVPGVSRVAGLFHWWSLPPWRRPVGDGEHLPSTEANQPRDPLSLLFDLPGTFFIQRTTIQRLTVRWGRIQIERRPSRSVSLAQVTGFSNPRDALRRLIEFQEWRSIVASL